MKAADLSRFFVVFALVSDLYCPGYDPKQSLAKDSNLIGAAARYKIDSAKIAAAIRGDFSKKTDNHRSESNSRQQSATKGATSQKLHRKQ
jgi:hypothetical protein